MILTEILEKNAQKYPNKCAFTMQMGYRSISLTNKELYYLARKTAYFLEENRISKGDKVLLFAPNSLYWIALFWGTLLQGAIIVPLNVQMTPKTIQKIAKETDAKILFKQLRSSVEVGEDIKVYDIELLEEYVKDIDFTYFEEQVIEESDVMQILYTSGTTGDPKGVLLTHANLSSNLITLEKIIPIYSTDRFLSILPLSHIFEQMVGFLLPSYKRSHIIYAHSPAAIPNLLKEHRITKMVAVPEFLSVVMSGIESKVREQGKTAVFNTLMKISRTIKIKPIQRLLFTSVHKKLGGELRTVASGGAALDKELEKKWEAFGVTLLQGYGLTETSPIVSANTFKDHRFGSVGKIIPGVEVKLIEDGEILVKGPNVFQGYFKDEEKTKEVFTSDGWFKTGDIGEIDKDGFLFIRGRKKYMIKGPGAQNVYPEDIEFELNKFPGIKDSCVIGRDKKSGAFEIHAVLVGEIEDLRKVTEETNKNLASYQRITSWSIWPHDDFPRSATRKVKREEVIKWLNEIEEETTKVEIGERKTPLIHLLSDVTEVSISEINPETNIVFDLNLDSLLRIELVARIEEKFGTVIDESKINMGTSVADLEVLIEKKEEPVQKIKFRNWTLSQFTVFLRTVNQILWIFPITRIFVNLEVKGIKNLKDLKHPAVFMPTHESHLDSLVLLMAFPLRIRKRIAYASALDVVYGKYKSFSFLVEFFFNSFPFPRKEDESIKAGLDYVGRLLDGNWSVAIYPEGKMSETGKLLPLKKGTGLIAVEMGVPIVPIKITNSRDVVPYGKFIPCKRAKVTITFGNPLTFSKKDSYIEVTKQIEEELRKL